HAVDVAGQVARGRVDLAAGEAARAGFGRRLGHARALGEHARGGVVDHAVDPGDVADHVVVEHRLDAPAFGLRLRGDDLAAEQALLLARQRGVDDGARESVLRQDARGLKRAGDAGGVVVGAGRVGGEVHHVRYARVDVAAHDHVAAGVRGTALDREHADHFGRLGNALLAGNRVADVDHFQAAAALRRDALELRV